jgi:hypothetical protein
MCMYVINGDRPTSLPVRGGGNITPFLDYSWMGTFVWSSQSHPQQQARFRLESPLSSTPVCQQNRPSLQQSPPPKTKLVLLQQTRDLCSNHLWNQFHKMQCHEWHQAW